jgi:hypothetical protein
MKRLVLPVLGIALGSLLLTGPASAQSFEVAQAGAKPTILLSKPEIVAEAMKKFDAKKTTILESMTRDLGRANGVGSGITLYVLNPRVGKATFRFVSTDTFEIHVTENVVPFCLAKPADSSAEPAGEIHFDIRVRGTMHLPTKETPQVAVTDATISTANITVKRGGAGDDAASFEKVSDFFQKMNPDRNVLRAAFDRYLRMEFNDQLNKGLRPINKKIAELAKKNLDPTCTLEGESLRVTMTGR